jgi:hypothetical protein
MGTVSIESRRCNLQNPRRLHFSLAPKFLTSNVPSSWFMLRANRRAKKRYDPVLCKTCQAAKRGKPRVARFRYSDCELHFKGRVKNFAHCGVHFTKGTRYRRVRIDSSILRNVLRK